MEEQKKAPPAAGAGQEEGRAADPQITNTLPSGLESVKSSALSGQANYILYALQTLHDHGEACELCIAGPQVKKHRAWGGEFAGGKNPMVSGWFLDLEKAASIVAEVDSQTRPVSIYVTLNPVSDALRGRANERLKASADRTQDADVIRRRWIYVDLDPNRPKGVSASEDEKKAAKDLARKVRDYLLSLGWPDAVVSDSGNGFHLLYQVDLPNDEESRDLVKNVLQALASVFDTPQVSIDTSVYNAARLIKLPGTVARKGDSTDERPHRRSGLLHVPEQIEVVPLEKLQELAARTPDTPERNQSRERETSSPNGFLDVEGYLAHYGRECLGTRRNGESTLFLLQECEFDPTHTAKESAIGQSDDGKLFYWCFHNSCQERTWQEARQLISGDDSLAPFMIGGNYQEQKAERGQKEEPREESKEEEPEITICTLGDIAEQEFSDNPLIHNLLDENESLLLCGQSGIGKSLITLQMALTLGRTPAASLWGKFAVSRPLRSLVVQSENPGKAMNKRLRLMAGGDPDLKQGIDNTYLPVVNGDCRLTGELTEEAFRAKLIQLIQTVQADILILDPLISYTTGDENDNAAMRHSLDCLTDVQDKTGTASIVVHHLGKAAASGDFNDVFSGRGASAIGDWAANILTLKKEKQEDSEVTIEALHHKARNFELQPPFYLKRTPDLQFHLCERPGTKQDQHVQAAVESLEELGGTVPRQSYLENKTMEKANLTKWKARRAIKRACELNLISTFPSNDYQNATGLRLSGAGGATNDYTTG